MEQKHQFECINMMTRNKLSHNQSIKAGIYLQNLSNSL